MRALKFRAWNKRGKFYLYDVQTMGFDDYIRENGIEQEVEQYTGLKDKNGKPIYEGDIVRDGKGEKCLIKWAESEAHFGLYDGGGMELTDFIWMQGEDLEVIGNVHENEELLEG